MRPRTRGLLLAAGLVAGTAGCGNLTAGKQKAEQAVEAFHQRFDEAREPVLVQTRIFSIRASSLSGSTW